MFPLEIFAIMRGKKCVKSPNRHFFVTWSDLKQPQRYIFEGAGRAPTQAAAAFFRKCADHVSTVAELDWEESAGQAKLQITPQRPRTGTPAQNLVSFSSSFTRWSISARLVLVVACTPKPWQQNEAVTLP